VDPEIIGLQKSLKIKKEEKLMQANHLAFRASMQSRLNKVGDVPRFEGMQNSPINPHFGMSGGGSSKIPQVSGEYTVTI